MNIRKFVGATSRDALRLVREALGSDAVVLSNRTIEDGTVEIVALADSDLAAISPAQRAAVGFGSGASSGAGNSGNGNFGHGLNGGAEHSGANTGSGTAGNATMSTGFGGAPASRPAAMPSMYANPYASDMPDVFSSVFGASPEAGAGVERAAAPVSETGSNDSSTMTGHAGDATSSARTTDDARVEIRSEARHDNRLDARADSRAPGRPESRIDARAEMPTPPSVMTPLPAIAETPGRQRTMVETNPWLIDHARRIAATDVAHTAKPVLTPAAAMARGLGAPVDMLAAIDDPATPDWAREAAELAARRAARHAVPAQADVKTSAKAGAKAGANPLAGLPPGAAAAVTDGIKARMEQIVNETVMNELASIRGMMEEQFTGLLWADRQRRSPTHAALTRHLFAAGFSAQLVKMVVENLPAVDSMDAGMEWVHSVLGANLPVIENEDALMERGGVFALMGPTGVGKTTTTAKLAARCVMRFGASKVALLTTDSYRIGGHEQLRIFGKILGVSVHAVKDGADLQLALNELRNKHIVLIDTIGMSQRDRSVSDQIAMLCGTGQPVQRLLLLNATSHGDTLNEVVQAYQQSPDNQALAGCILTKLDEATNLGSVLDTVIRYKLPVHYVSTGQKVPENLYVATKKFLIKSAFCIPRDGSPFVPQDDDVPALLSALSARSTADLHEVRFG
ncbi:flagellar biosynthesis protein FlhF [Paraburkholderia sartisoli]|uniref:flagellar biosynthesis protein FlhF n=1 Tax=Paraburkholderia sartisoli TaxID=83784 RepID=UPI0011607558|nr:flagellar biosynthesis protein FlhF [Paraburkholderia sartisoli]